MNTSSAHNPADDSSGNVEQRPFAIERSEDAKEHSASSTNADEKKAGWPQRIEATCAILLVVITFFYTRYAAKQTDILEANSRPYVGIEAINPTENSDHTGALVMASVKNFGTKPAIDLSGRWTAYLNGQEIPRREDRSVKEPYLFLPGRIVWFQANIGGDKWQRISAGQDTLAFQVQISYKLRENGPSESYCEQDEYNALAKKFSPSKCSP
jgi:hypothetical protein